MSAAVHAIVHCWVYLRARRSIIADGRRWRFAIGAMIAFVPIGVVARKRPREATAAAPTTAPTAVPAKPFLTNVPRTLDSHCVELTIGTNMPTPIAVATSFDPHDQKSTDTTWLQRVRDAHRLASLRRGSRPLSRGPRLRPGDPYASAASLAEAMLLAKRIARVGEDGYGRTLAISASHDDELSCWQFVHRQEIYNPEWVDGMRDASTCPATIRGLRRPSSAGQMSR